MEKRQVITSVISESITVKEKRREARFIIRFLQATSRLTRNQLRSTSLYHGPRLLAIRQHDDAYPPKLYYCNNVDMCQRGII